MDTVSPDTAAVNAANVSLPEVIEWVEKLSARSDMSDNAARLRVTAIRQFEEFVAPDEPKDAGWMLKNIDKLTDRWLRRNLGAKPETAKTYATRVRTTVQEYLKWSAAPHDYDPKRSIPKKDDASKKAKPVAKEVERGEEMAPPKVDPKPYVAPAEHMDRIPLGGGRHLLYLAPKDGLHLKDAVRAAYALILACEDYDPSQTPMQVMAQALSGSS